MLAAGGIISVQVVNELANVSRKKLRMSWEEIDEVLAAIRVLCPSPLPLTIDTHAAGRRIQWIVMPMPSWPTFASRFELLIA